MLCFDIHCKKVLLLQTSNGDWVYPPDDLQKLYDAIGFMVDDSRLLQVQKKLVCLMYVEYTLKLSSDYALYKWISIDDADDVVKEIYTKVDAIFR